MSTHSDEQKDRLQTVLQDADLRRQQQQTSTNLDHALAQANDTGGGRFGALGNPYVTGSTPGQQVPPLPSSSPWSGAQPEPGIEPPTGYRIDQLTDPEQVLSTPEPFHSPAQDPGPASDTAPSSGRPGDAERPAVGPSSSSRRKRRPR